MHLAQSLISVIDSLIADFMPRRDRSRSRSRHRHGRRRRSTSPVKEANADTERSWTDQATLPLHHQPHRVSLPPKYRRTPRGHPQYSQPHMDNFVSVNPCAPVFPPAPPPVLRHHVPHRPVISQTSTTPLPPRTAVPYQAGTVPRQSTTLAASSVNTLFAEPAEWNSSPGFRDTREVYQFSLPDKIANTPYTQPIGIGGLRLEDIKLIQVIHRGLANWLLRPMSHGRFVTWEGFRSRAEALLWGTASKTLRPGRSVDIIQLEKDAAAFLGCDTNDFGQRIKVHERLFLEDH